MIAGVVRGLRARRKHRWESLCRRCGLCCFEKEYRGRTVITHFSRPCPHLDLALRQCTVYEKRLQACPNCRKMTIWHALFVRWLPAGCGYVQQYRLRRPAGGRRFA